MGLPVAGWGALGTWVGRVSRNWVEVSEGLGGSLESTK